MTSRPYKGLSIVGAVAAHLSAVSPTLGTRFVSAWVCVPQTHSFARRSEATQTEPAESIPSPIRLYDFESPSCGFLRHIRPLKPLNTPMIGKDAFCPKTGAPLSEEKHYDERGRPQRAALPNESSPKSHLPGELTNGAVCSSKAALFNHFRKCHQRHGEADSALYRKAALGLSRLKRVTNGRNGWDVYVWHALYKRLDRANFDVEWMHTHAEPRCPHCHGQLTYERYDNGDVRAQCGTRCTEPGVDELPEIRETIADLYTQAFEASIDQDNILQFS